MLILDVMLNLIHTFLMPVFGFCNQHLLIYLVLVIPQMSTLSL